MTGNKQDMLLHEMDTLINEISQQQFEPQVILDWYDEIISSHRKLYDIQQRALRLKRKQEDGL